MAGQATSDLSWEQNTAVTVKSALQQLYFITMLRKAGLNHMSRILMSIVSLYAWVVGERV